MSGLYTVSRIFAGILGFISLVGVVWFSSALNSLIAGAGALLALTSLAVAFVPQQKLSTPSVRGTAILLCVVGIGAGLVLTFDDLRASRDIEWDIVSMKLINLIALAVIAVVAFRKSPSDPPRI